MGRRPACLGFWRGKKEEEMDELAELEAVPGVPDVAGSLMTRECAAVDEWLETLGEQE
jgi:hypothetical protein